MCLNLRGLGKIGKWIIQEGNDKRWVGEGIEIEKGFKDLE
jgi:hypothetical protein